MSKQRKQVKPLIVRQLQQSGNRLSFCVSPEVQEALEVKKGDNLSFEIDSEAGFVKLRKVVPSDQALEDTLAKTPQGNEKVFGVGDGKPNPPDEIKPFTNCVNCGSADIEVDGDEYFCPRCDTSFKITANGVRVIKSGSLSELKERVDGLEDDVRDLQDNKSGEETPKCPSCGSTDAEVDSLGSGWGVERFFCNNCGNSFEFPPAEETVGVAAEPKEDEEGEEGEI